jgi:hypothetical protein
VKLYVLISGAMFVLLLVAHAARFIAEGASVAANPTFVVSTVLALAMSGWAVRVFRALPRDK